MNTRFTNFTHVAKVMTENAATLGERLMGALLPEVEAGACVPEVGQLCRCGAPTCYTVINGNPCYTCREWDSYDCYGNCNVFQGCYVNCY